MLSFTSVRFCVYLRCQSSILKDTNKLNNKPKILFIAFEWRPLGGLEIYNRYLINTLTTLGCEVQAWGLWNQSAVPFDKGYALPLAPKSGMGLRIYARYAWKKLLKWRLQRILPQYDLVIIGHINLLPGFYSAWSKCSRQPPYWVWAYGIEAWEALAPQIIQSLQNAQCITAISNYTATLISSKLSDSRRIYVIPNPVDTGLFKPSPEPLRNDVKILLTVGRLSSQERYKGHEVVMQALPLIKSKLKTAVHYWIVGSGDDLSYLQCYAKQLGVAGAVEFTGWLAGARLVKAYQTCDVFVMPSRVEQRPDGAWTGEGFGQAYVEAAACAKPVIASNQGGAPETIINGVTGFSVDSRSPEAVAEAACRLLSNPALAHQMGQAGRQFVIENFSLEVFQRRVKALLEEKGF